MKPTANAGAEAPLSLPGDEILASAAASLPPSDHDPDATNLLRRYLAEVHSFRETGNQALRDLEGRLSMYPAGEQTAVARPGSLLVTPSLPSPPETESGFNQRLNDLSAYLHTDLGPDDNDPAASTVDQAAAETIRHGSAPKSVAAQSLAAKDMPAGTEAGEAPAPSPHKTPTLPVLDRAWFEERFAALCETIERRADDMPLQRIEALEAQFRYLMDRLAEREIARDQRPMEASLKELASYLEDNRQWQSLQDKRMTGVEERLDRVSDLVARSNAAILATAQGLEKLAGNPGEAMARETADIVIAGIGERIAGADPSDRLDKIGRDIAQLAGTSPNDRLEQLGREVANLSAQSRISARTTEDRLGHIESMLKESRARAAAGGGHAPIFSASPEPKALAGTGRSHGGGAPARGTASDRSAKSLAESRPRNRAASTQEDYDSEMIAAARRAAQLADGSPHAARDSNTRHQIPYGDFLPNDDSPGSRAVLIMAVLILAFAGVVMLFLKAKDWTLTEPGATAMHAAPRRETTSTGPARKAASEAPRASGQGTDVAARTGDPAADGLGQGRAVVTGSTPAAPPLAARQIQLQVATGAGNAGTSPASAPDSASTVAPAPAPASTPEMTPPATSFRQAAIGGDARAQFSAGESYLSGDGRAANLSDEEGLSAAGRWFRRAAESGYAPAQFKLATLYELGWGARRDASEAARWYERAATQGHVASMYALGMLAGPPNKVPADHALMLKWFGAAAAYGHSGAQFYLGLMSQQGAGLPRDLVEAYIWFALAARQNEAKAAARRDDIRRMLTMVQRLEAEDRLSRWKPKTPIAEVNRAAAEPPVVEPVSVPAEAAATAPAPVVGSAVAPAPAPPATVAAKASPAMESPAVASPAIAPATAPRVAAPAATPTAAPVAANNTAIRVAANAAALAPAPANAQVRSSGGSLLIAEAQRLLRQRGYDPGPVDGVPGPRTQAAIRSFQRQAGVPDTGEVTESLIVKMAFLPL